MLVPRSTRRQQVLRPHQPQYALAAHADVPGPQPACTLRCPSLWNGQAARTARIASTSASSSSFVFGPRFPPSADVTSAPAA